MSPVPPYPVNYAKLGDVRFGRFFWVIALFLISSQAHVRAAQSVRLAWNASPSSGVTGYRVYSRTSSGGQSTSVNVGNVLTATISDLDDATTYLFWVTAHIITLGSKVPLLIKFPTRLQRHLQKRICLL
jgi:Fibronectin type III domain